MSGVEQHEEAAKALELGKKALDTNQLERAVKLFEKSLRMRKTAEAESLLTCAKKNLARQEAKRNVENVTPSTPPKSDRPYTKDQEDACAVVLKAKTHYETLSVERTATAEEIKKSYRKLALKFHPDKCSAPKADEAFKKISKAFKVLLDPDERANYDRYGETDNVARAGGGGGGMNGFRHAHGNFHEMDADDLFRAFFGGMDGPFGNNNMRFHFAGPQHHHHQHRQAPRAGARQNEFSMQPMISFFIMIVFMLTSMGVFDYSGTAKANSPRSNQVFSLFPDKHYSIRRATAMHGVVSDIPYYVDNKFASTIGRSPRDLYYVEREIEATLYQNLKDKCQSELAFRLEQINRAKHSNDRNAIDKASKLDTPSCTLQMDFERRKRGGK